MGLALANDEALSGQGRGPHATDHAHWSRPLMNTAPVRVVIIHSIRLRSIYRFGVDEWARNKSVCNMWYFTWLL